MSAIPDHTTLKRLVMVRQLYQLALTQSAAVHSHSRRIMAVVGFDLAVETILKAIFYAFSSKGQPKDNFADLFDQAYALIIAEQLPPLPDRPKMLIVHGVRNAAQHAARYPNESELIECRVYTRDFLQAVTANTWGLTFESISLTDLVQDEAIRQHLKDAEAAFSQGDYKRAVGHASVGLRKATDSARAAVVGPELSPWTYFLVSNGSGKAEEDLQVKAIFQRMQETLAYIALGLNYADYMRHKQIAGEPLIATSGAVRHRHQKEDIDESEAEFVLSYCTDSIIEIQARVESLAEPFGKDSWRWY